MVGEKDPDKFEGKINDRFYGNYAAGSNVKKPGGDLHDGREGKKAMSIFLQDLKAKDEASLAGHKGDTSKNMSIYNGEKDVATGDNLKEYFAGLSHRDKLELGIGKEYSSISLVNKTIARAQDLADGIAGIFANITGRSK